jgi:hypothetical protein
MLSAKARQFYPPPETDLGLRDRISLFEQFP